jgi:hypothetical protein
MTAADALTLVVILEFIMSSGDHHFSMIAPQVAGNTCSGR